MADTAKLSPVKNEIFDKEIRIVKEIAVKMIIEDNLYIENDDKKAYTKN